MRYFPKGGACPRAGRWPDPGGEPRRDAEQVKRDGWQEQGVLVIAETDHRLTPDQVRGRLWPERELVRQLGAKLYGARPQEVSHG